MFRITVCQTGSSPQTGFLSEVAHLAVDDLPVDVTATGGFISTLSGNQCSSGKYEKRCLSSSIRIKFQMEKEQDRVKLGNWSKDRNCLKTSRCR